MTTSFTILIVDNNNHDREVLRHRLLQEGFAGDIWLASDPLAALHLLNRATHSGGVDGHEAPEGHEDRAGSVQLILLEIETPESLPGMSGCEFVEALRSDAIWHGLPVYMVSGSQDDGLIRRGYAAGASGYIAKRTVMRDFSLLTDLIRAFEDIHRGLSR